MATTEVAILPSEAPAHAGDELLVSTFAPRWSYRFWVWGLWLIVLAGLTAYIYQLRRGLAATAMTNYFSWGIYIVNFVFFIGISMAGTLISAMLRLTGATWRHPITRLAEAITLIALLIAAPMIIIDMGRPERLWKVLVYGRLQSPIVWDVLSLATYMAYSALYLYLPMIPDLAALRDSPRSFTPARRRLYRVLAARWTGTPRQRQLLDRAITIMSVAIIPVAISIHTVTAWLFGMTLRPGWHSTIIGPDFVVGALYSGVAAVITAIAVFRWRLGLHQWITLQHLRRLCLLMVIFGIAYAYFLLNEHAGSVYTREGRERRLGELIFTGAYAIQFWTMVLLGLVAPVVVLALTRMRSVGGIVTASLLVNVGMWLKRYIIVVPTLAAPIMPPQWQGKIAYSPTLVEWLITAGGFAAFALMYTFFARLFPVISWWELEEEEREQLHRDPAVRSASLALAGIAAFVMLVGIGVRQAAAADTTRPSTQAAGATPLVALATADEDGKRQVVATVTLGGKPLENAQVAFRLKRAFGFMLLGSDKTLDDGTAAAELPRDLPAEANGEVEVTAEVAAGPNYAAAESTALFPGTPSPANAPLPRALWAPHAPRSLIAAIGITLAVSWGVFAYVLFQLFKLIRSPKGAVV
ncbi:MAG: NrfD/PsrC family molybdoenzyme membrane anchor subunit [Tepidisphaeraceae bacterium]